jgi:hypothetical protein
VGIFNKFMISKCPSKNIMNNSELVEGLSVGTVVKRQELPHFAIEFSTAIAFVLITSENYTINFRVPEKFKRKYLTAS